jgi:putative membrane protein insertion efficiency factor
MMAPSSHSVILSEAKNPVLAATPPAGSFALLRMTAGWVCSLPARAASGLVWVYQRTVSPALAAAFPSCGCRFAPTCSHYAREALQGHGFLAGTALTVVRLAKCGPWHPGGADPVPPSRRRPVCARVTPC